MHHLDGWGAAAVVQQLLTSQEVELEVEVEEVHLMAMGGKEPWQNLATCGEELTGLLGV